VVPPGPWQGVVVRHSELIVENLLPEWLEGLQMVNEAFLGIVEHIDRELRE
jgi:hypothetical protein